MARTTGSTGARTEVAIRQAALELIATHGFPAMTLRQLAEKVGIQAGSIYRYFPSKSQLLVDLLVEHLQSLLASWQVECPDSADPLVRLRAFVDFHIRQHTLRRREVFVANMELRSLAPADYRRVVALRRRYELLLTGILSDGIEQGLFQLTDARVATFAILAMLTGVGTWFRENGRLGKRELIEQYTMAKLLATEMAEKVYSDAIQIHGGYGCLNDFRVERIHRDVRVCQIYEGTSDIQRILIGRALASGG